MHTVIKCCKSLFTVIKSRNLDVFIVKMLYKVVLLTIMKYFNVVMVIKCGRSVVCTVIKCRRLFC